MFSQKQEQKQEIIIKVKFGDSKKEHQYNSFDKIEPEKYQKITQLVCSNNNLQNDDLPELPKTLKILDISWNKLTKLPKIPESLRILDCSYNQISEINSNPKEKLPDKLKLLDVSWNNLKEMINLPNGLSILYCQYNNLEKIVVSNLVNLTKLDISWNKVKLNESKIKKMMNGKLKEYWEYPISLPEKRKKFKPLSEKSREKLYQQFLLYGV